MHKKPFHSDNRTERRSFGEDEQRGSRKPARNEDRPSRKRQDEQGDRPERKSYGNQEERGFRKPFDKKGEVPSRKPYGDREQKPFRKPFGDKEDKPFRKSFGNKEDKPFRKSFGDKEDKPFRKSFGDKEDKPFRKSFGDKEGKPFRKSFDKEDKPFRKSFGDKEDKPFRKSFGDKEGKPFKKSWDKPEEKGFKKRDDRNKDHEGEKEAKKPNRYANTFGKLDDEELIALRKKQQEQKEQKEQQEEVTFSKELDKWSEEPQQERSFGKSDVKPGRKKADGEGKRPRHDAQSRFKKQFDNENDYEKAYTSAPGKKEETENQVTDAEDQLMPLNKYIAHCDVCSRRDAVTLIKDGKVTVNGELITEPGHKVTIADTVHLNGQQLTIQKNLIYILMNKPKGFITTTDDPKGRRTVMEMVENLIEERVFPVGRLDRNTTGLLLLTNDGELAQKLSHPKHGVKKVYKATLDKSLSKADFDKIKEGVELEDGKAEVDQLEYLDQKNEIGMEIHSGKNRIVRRIFESLGYEVEKLDRVLYAGLTKKNILRGKWRFLTKQEVINLRNLH